MFITFEGIDRSGKTTQARLLAEALGDDALLVREPGGTPAAERIRELVKDPDVTLSPIAETLLFGAARAELLERVVRPALDAGKAVICDRYIDSTVAYQGGARGLGIDRVEELNDWIAGGLWPDVTFLLDVPPARRAASAAASWTASSRRARSSSARSRPPTTSWPSATPAATCGSTLRGRRRTSTRDVLAEVEARRAGAVR